MDRTPLSAAGEAADAQMPHTTLADWVRRAVLLVAIVVSVLIGVHAAQPPAAKPATAPPTDFSAARAMADIRVIAQRPHSATSANLARVQSYLFARMTALGLRPEQRRYMIDSKALDTLRRWNAHPDPTAELTDLVGVLPGRDRQAPAVAVMAHMDTVWGSPGGGDDSAGVASILELVRAIRVRGTPARDIIVLLTDGEEVGLSGAKDFWRGDGLPRHIGVVVNLEARGSGGRATMFETGADNGGMIELMKKAVRHPVANAMAVMAYRRMPNDTDFTPVRDAGVQGFNFAIMGRPQYYHSPQATADRTDPRSVQDMGDQALALVSALADARVLPAPAPDRVFFDVAGRGMIAYPPARGWMLVLVAAAALGAAVWQLRRQRLLTGRGIGEGVGAFLWLATQAYLLVRLLNLWSGSVGANYYDRLAALPRLEAQAAMALMAAMLAWLGSRGGASRIWGLIVPLLLALGCWRAGQGGSPIWAAAACGMVAAWLTPAQGVSRWGGWIGALLPIVVGAAILQHEAPMAAWLVAWPALILCIAAALVAVIVPRLGAAAGWIVAGVAAVLVTAPLIPLAHLTFLGIGAARPEALLPMMLVAAAAWWPLARPEGHARTLWIAAAALVVMAGAIALHVRSDPIADTVPAYTLDK